MFPWLIAWEASTGKFLATPIRKLDGHPEFFVRGFEEVFMLKHKTPRGAQDSQGRQLAAGTALCPEPPDGLFPSQSAQEVLL